MFNIGKPISLAEKRRVKRKYSVYSVYADYRENRWRYFFRLMNSLWFFAFLAIGARIGSVTLFVLSDFTKLKASHFLAQHNAPLEFPVAKSSDRCPNSRHVVFVSIDRSGRTLINGREYLGEKMQNVFNRFSRSDSQMTVVILADKNLEMRYLHEVFVRMSKTYFHQIHFVVQDK